MNMNMKMKMKMVSSFSCCASLCSSSTSSTHTKRSSLTPPLCHQTPISPSPSHLHLLHKSIPLAAASASASILLLCASPANAGFLSGFSGLESIPGPQLPQFDFLTKFNEENQKKYAEFDERFKSSPVLKELLEKSKLNKQRNKREIQDKYCIRGAEWGVGDCSTQGMTQEERDEFIAILKKKSGED